MDELEVIREEVEITIKNAAYDYYLSYVKDEMDRFKDASEIIGMAIYTFFKTAPAMMQYITYCKLTASNEILKIICERDYNLIEPIPVTMAEFERNRPKVDTDRIDEGGTLMNNIIMPLCERYYNSYINNDPDDFRISAGMLNHLSLIAAGTYPDINHYINYCKVRVLDNIWNEGMPREYLLTNHPLIIFKLVDDGQYVINTDVFDDSMAKMDNILINKIRDVLDDAAVNVSSADTGYIIYQLLKDDNKHDLSEMDDEMFKERIMDIIGGV